MHILVLHGPNLHLLGQREPALYGHTRLIEINQKLQVMTDAQGVDLACFQSDSELELITRIHQAKEVNVRFIVFNPAGFTHTSVALRDALVAVEIPFIEVHLSNPYNREHFRHRSYFSSCAKGVIAGLGIKSYFLAIDFAIDYLIQQNKITKTLEIQTGI